MGTKWPNWVRNDQIENKSGYEMTKMVRNDLGTKWPGYDMTGYQIFKMAAPIPPMLKYSTYHNFLHSPPILIRFVSKFMDCKVLYLMCFKVAFSFNVLVFLMNKRANKHSVIYTLTVFQKKKNNNYFQYNLIFFMFISFPAILQVKRFCS